MKKLITAALLLLIMLTLLVTLLLVFPELIGTMPGLRDLETGDRQTNESAGLALLESWSNSIAGNKEPEISNSAVTDLAFLLTDGIDNDYDKMVAVYDWVTQNIAYDLEKLENISAFDSGAEYVLGTGRGICHDYAELTRALLTAVGIEVTYERGEVIPSMGEIEIHAWNNVLIGERWYALDTTWGAGFILEDRSTFIQKPRRIYLTTPEELRLLHNDPDYKEKREQEYFFEASVSEPVKYLSEDELAIYQFFNDYREKKGLSHLSEEMRIAGLARDYVTRAAGDICAGEEFSLGGLSDELTRLAGEMNIKSAATYALFQWLYYPEVIRNNLSKIALEQTTYLNNEQWEAVAIGAVRKGELILIVTIFLDYH